MLVIRAATLFFCPIKTRSSLQGASSCSPVDPCFDSENIAKWTKRWFVGHKPHFMNEAQACSGEMDIENVRPHAVIWKGQNRVTRVHESTVRPP